MNLDRIIESHNSRLLEIAEGNSYDNSACCPVCTQRLGLSDPSWFMPDEAGMEMDHEESYVCSEECAEEWREINWDVIEEYRIKKLS